MEFLVATTTRLPATMPDEEATTARAGESAYIRAVGKTRQLRRLWRSAGPDDGLRTVGLFDVDDTAELDKILAATPLRAWRTDEVTRLSAHVDDPALAGIPSIPGKGPESLVTMILMMPPDASAEEVEDTAARQSLRIRELAGQGNVVRMWALPAAPEGPAVLALWRARDAGFLMAELESLPLAEWMTIEITTLSPHRDDPVRG
jgi:muconolactone delta-isomerase